MKIVCVITVKHKLQNRQTKRMTMQNDCFGHYMVNGERGGERERERGRERERKRERAYLIEYKHRNE